MAKIIFASAASVIIGIYALSLAKADEASYAVAKAQALRTQTMQIALSGVKFATVAMAGGRSIPASGSGKVSLMGGSVNYTTAKISPVAPPYDTVKVTATGTYPLADTSASGRHQITYIAKLAWNSTHWVTASIYLVRDKNEYAKLN